MRPLAALAAASCLLWSCSGEKLQNAGAQCGNGVKEEGEECDNGAANGPNTGCEKDCTLSCIPGDALRGDAHCAPKDACKGSGLCQNNVCTTGPGLDAGTPCGTNEICRDGACASPVCGDGIVTPPEECDYGDDNVPGCTSCRFTCLSSDPARNCANANPCVFGAVCNDVTHTCNPGFPAQNGSDCGNGMICLEGQCRTPSCGDGIIEPGEQCDPPNGTTCDRFCQSVVCGDGKRNGSEQCDDGNTTNLDGCDATCHLEEAQRATSVTMLFAADSFCASNALGTAIASTAQSTLQASIDAAVTAGTMNILFQAIGLLDPTGRSGALTLGSVNGSPKPAPPLQKYNGNKDSDWWYAVDPAGLDGARKPLDLFSANISNALLTTSGAGRMTLTFVLGGAPAPLSVSGVKLKASIGPASIPKESILAETPGHLASERLDPALQSFGSMTNGELCGNISAASLAAMPVSSALLSGGAVACAEGYAAASSMLDVLVSGCTFLEDGFIPVTLISAAQPDQVDPQAPVAGAGGPYKLVASILTGKVKSCQDRNGSSVPLAACLNAAAYSSALGFASDRVILK